MIGVGCDIHIYVEKKNKETGDWEAVKGPNPRIDMYRRWAMNERKKGDFESALQLEEKARQIESGEALELAKTNYPDDEYQMIANAPGVYEDWIFDGRNYDLFAILADVRNGYGFAGCETGEGFNPIDQPRGLPDDVSSIVEKASEEWGIDGHSHSFITLRELLEYDWEQKTVQYGWVNDQVYQKFKDANDPYPCCGSVFGKTIVHLSNEEMDQLLSGDLPREEDKKYYTQIQWGESYKEAVGSFYTESIPALKELAGKDIDDVRIVFWFDN